MTPYFCLAIAMLLLGIVFGEIHPSRRKDLIYLAFFSVVMLLMAVVRYHTVGIDYDAYLVYFRQVCDNKESFFTWAFSAGNQYRREIGYTFVNWAISMFGSTQTVFAAGIGLVMYSLNFLLIWKYSSRPWISMFIFVTFGFFGYTMCTLRQEIGIRIFLLALPYLQRKKFLPYLLLTLLAGTMHISLYIFIPVFFLAWLPFNWKTASLYVGATAFVAVFSEAILSFVTQYVFKSYQVGTYFTQGRNAVTMYIPMVFAIVAAVMSKALIKRNPGNLPLINLSIYAGLLFLLTMKHFVFQRVALIALPVALLLVPEIAACVAPPQEQLDELETLRESVNSGNKKANLIKYNSLLAQTKDRRSLYYATVAIIACYSFLYYAFLLSANRLLLVPYTTIFFA